GLVAWLWVGGEEDSGDGGSESPPVVAKNEPEPQPEADGGEPPPNADDGEPPPEASGGVDPNPAAGTGGEAAVDGGGDDDMLVIEDDDGAGEDEGGDDGAVEPPPDAGTNPKPGTHRPPPKRNTGPVDVRSAKDLGKGFAKATKAAQQCGKTHGAIGGQSIAVEAAIKANGQVLSANATGLNRNTPLGKCVANAVKNNARFVASKQPLQTETRTYKM
ncbi:MAG: hypothetical protein KC501_36395, partial [Myxococcales bacterium]|nr:hypothetical protein [Myxococcales bacterium]